MWLLSNLQNLARERKLSILIRLSIIGLNGVVLCEVEVM
jgi:hypothetical protein